MISSVTETYEITSVVNRDQMVTILCKQTGTGELDLDLVVRKANLKLRTEGQCGIQQAKAAFGEEKVTLSCQAAGWNVVCLYH